MNIISLRMRYAVFALSAIIALAALPAKSSAGFKTFLGSSGTKSAEAYFDTNTAGKLFVTLRNTSTADAGVPTDILTALFFNSNVTLTRVSAKLYDPVGGPAAIVINGTQASVPSPQDGRSAADGFVGGEWAYKSGLSVGSYTNGISSAGLSDGPDFGPGDRFPGTDLAGPPSGAPDGIQYGITSAGDDRTTGNGGNGGMIDQYLIKSGVIFEFNTSAAFDLDALTRVRFQYGTGITEGDYQGNPPAGPPVPAPPSLVMAAFGIASLGLAGLRRFRR